MNVATLLLLIMILGISAAITAGNNAPATMELQAPKHILPQEVFNISCVYRGNGLFTMMVQYCNVISRTFHQEKDVGLRSWNFRVEHVSKQCVARCFSDGIITSTYYNITVSKGIPFTLTCSSKCKPGSCQAVWTTNNTSVFVKNDEEHTVWSGPSHKDTQSHYLTVHSASTSTDYHCSLISITGRIIASARQHVYVREPGNSTARMFIGYIKP